MYGSVGATAAAGADEMTRALRCSCAVRPHEVMGARSVPSGPMGVVGDVENSLAQSSGGARKGLALQRWPSIHALSGAYAQRVPLSIDGARRQSGRLAPAGPDSYAGGPIGPGACQLAAEGACICGGRNPTTQ